MKFTTKLFLTWMFIFLLFYLAVIAILGLFWGVRFPLWQLLLVFFIAGILPPGVLTLFYYKRLDYMESGAITAPVFAGCKKEVFSFNGRSGRDYENILQRIDRSFIISYSDRENEVIKFRTDSRVLAWGVCGYIHLLGDGNVEAVVYPMNACSEKEKKLLSQTLSLLSAVLSS